MAGEPGRSEKKASRLVFVCPAGGVAAYLFVDRVVSLKLFHNSICECLMGSIHVELL